MNKAPLFQKRSSILTPNKRPVNGGGGAPSRSSVCVLLGNNSHRCRNRVREEEERGPESAELLLPPRKHCVARCAFYALLRLFKVCADRVQLLTSVSICPQLFEDSLYPPAPLISRHVMLTAAA